MPDTPSSPPSTAPLVAGIEDSRLADPRRLAALHATGLLDAEPNIVLDRLARLTTQLLGVPIALVTLVDEASQHFPGLAGLGGWAGAARATPLSHSFCQHVVRRDATLIVDDAARDPLVRDNLAFHELGVVAYAGVPLRTATGETLGALCAIDGAPRRWSEAQVGALDDLAAAAMAEIELRATMRALCEAQAELIRAHDRLRLQAEHDALTGLLNRRGFDEAARRLSALAIRTSSPFLLVVLDLDDFKAINDTHGHDAGDAVLAEVGRLPARSSRAADVAARLGGDEFAVLVTDAGAAEADVVRARLAGAFTTLRVVGPSGPPVTASIGIAAWDPATPVSWPTLLRAADADMYARKTVRRAGTTPAR